jgi:hypothetical protein
MVATARCGSRAAAFHLFTGHNAPKRPRSAMVTENNYPRIPFAKLVLMSMRPHPKKGPTTLPFLVKEYVEATNSRDLERLLTLFADDALVNDQLRDYWGKPAIRGWAEQDIVGERLTMSVTKVVEHYGNFILTADVDGNFDKRGLPDPLVLAFYFTPHGDRIVQLIILRNRSDI